MNTRLPSPANDENHRNPIHLVTKQRGNRIDGIALAAVLHVHHRHPPSSQVIPCRQSSTIAFIGSYNMMPAVYAIRIHQVIAQWL